MPEDQAPRMDELPPERILPSGSGMIASRSQADAQTPDHVLDGSCCRVESNGVISCLNCVLIIQAKMQSVSSSEREPMVRGRLVAHDPCGGVAGTVSESSNCFCDRFQHVIDNWPICG